MSTFSGGDYNAKNTLWGSKLVNQHGRRLAEALVTAGLSIHTRDSPTHYRTGVRPDLIDFGLSNSLAVSVSEESVPELSSHHNPTIYVVWGEVLPIDEAGPKSVNWTQFL